MDEREIKLLREKGSLLRRLAEIEVDLHEKHNLGLHQRIAENDAVLSVSGGQEECLGQPKDLYDGSKIARR